MVGMFVHSLLGTLIVQIAVFGFGTYLRSTDSNVRRGIGMVLQTLSVLVIVVDLIRRAISSR
jgi:hypothetical protein